MYLSDVKCTVFPLFFFEAWIWPLRICSFADVTLLWVMGDAARGFGSRSEERLWGVVQRAKPLPLMLDPR